MQITVTEPNIKAFLDMTFSELVVLFFYYVVISRIWNKNQKVQFTKNQYILHFIIATYSLVNMIIIVEAVSRIEGETANFLLLLNVGFIVFADMYFLYFVQFIDKSNQTKEKLGLLEQQASMQYKYYVLQEKKYNESMKIMHDVNKHITIIEGLYKDKNTTDAICYTKEINEILKPLIPQRITDHPILNILLNDKMEYADKHNIEIQYEIGNVNLDFMNPIDITTIFGNLLDNAIEACEGIENEAKWIKIKISPYYKMIAIRIENPSKGHLKWKDKRPVSIKGTGHGIGLCNVEGVIKKYDGTMHLNDENGTFQCNIVINK